MTHTPHPSLASQTLGFIEELQNQAKYPPGNDMVIRACYLSLINYLTQNSQQQFFELLLSKRDFTPTHFANILFRAIQYMELFVFKNADYPQGFTTTVDWDHEIEKIFDEYLDMLIEILMTKDTTTTIYQRYAGVKFVVNSLYPNKNVSLVDLGCGGNLGLPGLKDNKEFEEIIDKTTGKSFTTTLNIPVQVNKIISIDKENPYEEAAINWRMACSYYPQELAKKTEVESHSEYKKDFYIMDATTSIPDEYDIKKNEYDAVIMSTFLYQLSKSNIKKVLEFAKSLLNKNGVIIIQDFAIKENNKFKLLNNWFSSQHPYATYILSENNKWEPMEILRWTNGRCKEVVEGRDYRFILEK